ncbi:MAG: error-prone DNA polymerase [Sphingomonadales bacterium 32-68-7]|nr:MAG: error-prone DNA polymerase [Sphingomonadales bacterium 32-68-7]
MPEAPLTPSRPQLDVDPDSIAAPARAPFVELGLVSCFSFLRGASLPVSLVETAWGLGYDAIGIADANSMAGVVRLHTNAKKVKLRPVIGCRIETAEGLAFLAYPTDRAAYGRLCRLISAGRMRKLGGEWQDKGACDISLAMLAEHAEGVQLILLPPRDLDTEFTIEAESNVVPLLPSQRRGGAEAQPLAVISAQAGNPSVLPTAGQGGEGEPEASLRLRASARVSLRVPFQDILPHLVRRLPTLRHLAASFLYTGDDIARIERLDALAQESGLTLLATNDVHYHIPERRPLQDVMTAIRHKVTVAEAGHRLHANAERHLKSPAEMQKLFARWPHAIAAARAVADACRFSLDELRYEYPRKTYPGGMTPQAYLIKLTWQGAVWRYPQGISAKVKKTLKYELGLIGKLKIAPYFLTIKEIVDFARGQDPPILCQGRGSAANSAVCFCLGITEVDPAEHQLLFDRFISEERTEPPDIDVDFEHERREEVIQHIYREYGRERAGLCATVIHYRPRMAVREVGKAMGLSEDVTSALARTVWGGHGRAIDREHVRRETGLDLADPQLRRVLALTEQMIDMPRHLSQHVGGFILTDVPLTETVPIGNGAMPERSFIEWDKDDIDDLGIFKIDILALGMLTCIRKALDLLEKHHDRSLTMATLPQEDPAVYDMLCKGDSVGVFQVESRAQMNMLPRLRPRTFYDLVVEVAIVRPGPRLPGPAPEHGPPDELSAILARTYGVPIFQEQAMKIALDAARFSAAEANQLRKAMATFRSRGMVHAHEAKMVGRMVARGYDPDFAQRCFNQIKGFGEYGFPESHAASFAHLVYVSSWLKCHYPAAFAAALLNSQPMGFYAPAQIVRDSQEHGVAVLPVDVNHSDWDCTLAARLEGPVALRLGLRQVDGLAEAAAARLVAARLEGGPFRDVAELRDRAGLSPSHVERLASADCFSSLELPRRQALWQARTLVAAPELPLFAAAREREEGAERARTHLPAMPLPEEVIADYQTQRLSLKAHPMHFLRASLAERGFLRTDALRSRRNRTTAQVAGVVLIRQRPGSAKGVCFITLEDEAGIANLVVWPDTFQKYRKVVMGARLIEVRGRIEYDEDVLHVIATHLADATASLHALSEDLLRPSMAYGDHCGTVGKPPPDARLFEPPGPGNRDCGWHGGHPRDARIIPKSRDFH